MPGITHMMMLGSDEGFGYVSNDVMDMILNWSSAHIPKMRHQMRCPERPKDTKKKRHHNEKKHDRN